MLGGSADAAGDVDRRRNSGAGLADLIAVRTPTVVGNRTAATDLATQRAGELFERRKRLFAADSTTAGNHHRRSGQGDALAQHGAVLDDRTDQTVVDLDRYLVDPSCRL